MMTDLSDNDNDPSQGLALKLNKVVEAWQTFGTRTAAQLWFEPGLDALPAMFESERPDDPARGDFH